MDKNRLIDVLRSELHKDLVAVKEAALMTYEAATHEESKPENEYDTRGLEAAYLASAQAKRAAQIEELLFNFKSIAIEHFDASKPIASTALVQVDLDGRKSWILIIPNGGGLMLDYEGQAVQTVTPKSPLGEALIGLKVGDVAVVETGKKVREYAVLAVY